MRPRCSILTGGFDFSGCGDCTSCPPFEQTEMSNNEPSATVLQDIPRMRGLYEFRFECQLLSTGDYAHSADRPYFGRHTSKIGPVSTMRVIACAQQLTFESKLV